MKLVDQYIDPSMANAARVRLRIAGIATHVDVMDPHNVQPSKSGKTRVGLWVLDETQHEDAIQVLINPEYKLKNPLSFDQISKLEAAVEKRPPPRRKFSDVAFILLLIAGLLGLIVYTAVEFYLGL